MRAKTDSRAMRLPLIGRSLRLVAVAVAIPVHYSNYACMTWLHRRIYSQLASTSRNVHLQDLVYVFLDLNRASTVEHGLS